MGSPHNVAALCLAALGVLCLAASSLADYNIGVGIADITGPSVEVNFMGYANLEQTGRGIHLRQFARSFIIEDQNLNRVAFVSTDTGMMSTGLRKEVLRQLSKVYGSTYNQSNLIISGTHTHSGPGGFNMDLLFDITILGFVQQTFHSYAAGIVRSIKMAHESMTPGKLHYKEGRLTNANINRSPSSYLLNPEAERNLYPDGDTDKKMVQLKMVSTNGTLLGAINWFAIHPTSMNNTNVLVSSDNVGYASVLLEEAINPPGTFPGKGKFVGAFASTNLGDISPNIMGPKCEFTGVSCDIHSSRCVNPDEKCFAQGPGKDMFDSTKIIAQRIKTEGLRLLQSQDDFEVTGPIKTIHQFIDMAHISVPDYNPKTGQFMRDAPVRGCLPAMGYSFAAGTTDGPGAFNFSQGTTTGNPLWNSVRNLLAEPTPDDIECQKPKPILLATGRITFPYEWQPTIVSSQLALIGDVVLAAVPGEFTTMSGRRMRSVLTNTFAAAGKDVKVVVAGLSNTYSDYVATPEEYQAQRYEAASTIFGPHTLTIHLNQFNDLAKALMEDRTLDPGPTPTDFSNDLISLVTPVIFDIAPWGLSFGECVVEPNERYTFGNVVHVKFVSGNPRNNLMTEKSYLTVERYIEQDGSWEVVATDAHWETRFVWERTSLILGTSKVNIYWEVTDKAPVGTYRIQHFGYFRYILGSTKSYSGRSRTFQIY